MARWIRAILSVEVAGRELQPGDICQVADDALAEELLGRQRQYAGRWSKVVEEGDPPEEDAAAGGKGGDGEAEEKPLSYTELIAKARALGLEVKHNTKRDVVEAMIEAEVKEAAAAADAGKAEGGAGEGGEGK